MKITCIENKKIIIETNDEVQVYINRDSNNKKIISIEKVDMKQENNTRKNEEPKIEEVFKDNFLNDILGAIKNSSQNFASKEKEMANQSKKQEFDDCFDIVDIFKALTEGFDISGEKLAKFFPKAVSLNPLHGKEEDVIEDMVMILKILNDDSSDYFKDLNEKILRNALKVLKRAYGNGATLIDLENFLSNTAGFANKALRDLSRRTKEINKENQDLISYFKNVYFPKTFNGEESKDFINSSALRTQISKLIASM